MTTTKVTPKLIQNIDDDSVIIWFEKPNKYVVTTETNSRIIQLYMNPETSRDSFVTYISDTLVLDNESANAIYVDVSSFISNIHQPTVLETSLNYTPSLPTEWITHSYAFYNKHIRIQFASETIKSLIHPQIAHHHVISEEECDTQFSIFRHEDDLFLHRNGEFVGNYKTRSFHFLQGRFALELTNSIHSKNIDKWIATFHASTISNGEQSIMIIGDSGNGKSTLSVLLMAHGFDILCDDFTPLYEEDMNLYRYPAATSVKKGAFDTLQSYLNTIETLKTHTNGPKKVNIKYVPPLERYDNQTSNFPCQHIVYVKYDQNKKSSLTKASKAKILETLIPDSWISPDEQHARKFVNWFKSINCFELNYSDNDFAISKFKSLFNKS